MATIIMESAKVIEAANNTIERIMCERNKRDEVTIANAIRLEKRFSFRRGFYSMNREEAITWIKKQGWMGSWSFSQYAWGDLDKAKNILRLANHGDPVTLNEDDIRVLFD